MEPATPSYSLDYFEELFGSRTPAFWELVAALADELLSYASEVGRVAATGDPAAVARLRHDHRPLVENLKLRSVAALEDNLKRAMAAGVPSDQDGGVHELAREVLAVSRALTSERLRAFPGPQPPSRGG